MLKRVPPNTQPEEASISLMGRGPVGPTGTGSTEEALSASPLVLIREEPAENPRASPRQNAGHSQALPRIRDCRAEVSVNGLSQVTMNFERGSSLKRPKSGRLETASLGCGTRP